MCRVRFPVAFTVKFAYVKLVVSDGRRVRIVVIVAKVGAAVGFIRFQKNNIIFIYYIITKNLANIK